MSMFFFFFFQAEDGIRDVAVTGVQTCALPISGGTHTPSDPSFVKKVVGEDIYKRYQKNISISTTKNPGCKYEWIGVTARGTPVELNKELFDRDLLISSMNVQPHYFAGYEGGAKALLPGCAGLKTIATNHGYVVGDTNCREL